MNKVIGDVKNLENWLKENFSAPHTLQNLNHLHFSQFFPHVFLSSISKLFVEEEILLLHFPKPHCSFR